MFDVGLPPYEYPQLLYLSQKRIFVSGGYSRELNSISFCYEIDIESEFLTVKA